MINYIQNNKENYNEYTKNGKIKNENLNSEEPLILNLNC